MQSVTNTSFKKWAFSQSSERPPAPLDDVNVLVEYGDMLLALASDPRCPKRGYILRSLYKTVGENVSLNNKEILEKIQLLLSKVSTDHDVCVVNWAARSKMIIRDLRKYDYVEWCEGGFADKDLASAS